MGLGASPLVFIVQNPRGWYRTVLKKFNFLLKAVRSHSDLSIYKTAGGKYGLFPAELSAQKNKRNLHF